MFVTYSDGVRTYVTTVEDESKCLRDMMAHFPDEMTGDSPVRFVREEFESAVGVYIHPVDRETECEIQSVEL